ncbi:signal peptidase I [Paracidobacterium acidisoli]|nr:signal peptidase I [Paracidobacterium acidisoli]MBT9332124.1 signal peptidase I [Paracidobacterium acidisoli]
MKTGLDESREAFGEGSGLTAGANGLAQATLPPPPDGAEVRRGPSAHPHSHFHIYPGPLDTTQSLLSILVIAIFVLTFIVQPFRIPSESMERTLLVGDFLLVNKTIFGPPGHWKWLLPYRPEERGDVVVFYFPVNPAEHVVKRVIGVPGDRIHLRGGVVYRNGQPLNEPYVVFEPAYPDNFRDNFPIRIYTDPGVDMHWWQQLRRTEQQGDVVVPAGQYFVMGDNRNHSRDSRYWGFVPEREVVGRPFVIYFSLRRPSTTDVQLPPDDKLGHNKDLLTRVLNFARWGRFLRIIR